MSVCQKEKKKTPIVCQPIFPRAHSATHPVQSHTGTVHLCLLGSCFASILALSSIRSLDTSCRLSSSSLVRTWWLTKSSSRLSFPLFKDREGVTQSGRRQEGMRWAAPFHTLYRQTATLQGSGPSIMLTSFLLAACPGTWKPTGSGRSLRSAEMPCSPQTQQYLPGVPTLTSLFPPQGH